MANKTVRDRLRNRGFLIVDGGSDANSATVALEMGLREFQRYAKMEQVARHDGGDGGDLVSHLTSVANTKKYTGFVDGQPNPTTLDILAEWENNDWRCPVLIQAWHVQATSGQQFPIPATVASGCQNIWIFNEVKDASLRMYAFDFTGHFRAVAIGGRPEKVVVGRFPIRPGTGPFGVPPAHTVLGNNGDPGSEVRPETTYGRDWSHLTPTEQATFRLIRITSETECLGYFDSFNAYDHALLSIGLFHWTLGLHFKIGDAELAAVLAYCKKVEPLVYEKAVGVWGVGPLDEWGDAGEALAESNGTYTTTFGHQNAAGVLTEIEDVAAAHYRSWHWIYRFQAAVRALAGFRRAMWDMARLRLRTIRDTPFVGVSPLPDGTKIGEVFKSPLANAMLLRWHINLPGDIIGRNVAAPNLVNVFNAGFHAPFGTNPAAWPTCAEKSLTESLDAAVTTRGDKNLRDTVNSIKRWPDTWLATNPSHFHLEGDLSPLSPDPQMPLVFDVSGLPPAPPHASAHAKSLDRPDILRESRELKAVAATLTDRTVLRAFARGGVVYQVSLKNGVLVSEPVGSAPNPNAITRIALYDPNVTVAPDFDSPLLVVFPVLSVDKLSFDAKKKELSADFEFRWWLPHSGDKASQQCDWKIVVDPATRRIVFKTLHFDEMNPLSSVSALALGNLGSIDFDEVNSFDSFPLVAPLNLATDHDTIDKIFHRRLGFTPTPLKVGDEPTLFPALLLTSTMGIRSAEAHQRLEPLGIEFEGSELPVPPEGAKPRFDLMARQARDGWDDNSGHWILEVRVPQRAALALWNARVTDPVISAIHIVEAGRPVSVLPRFAEAVIDPATVAVPPQWIMRYSIVDRSRADDIEPETISFLMPREPMPHGKTVALIPRFLSPADIQDADASVPGLLTTDAEPLTCRFTLHPDAEVSLEQSPMDAANEITTQFQFGVTQTAPRHARPGESPAPAQVVRMGAVDVTFLPAMLSDGEADPDLHLPPVDESVARATFASCSAIAERELKCSLAVRELTPGDQDDVPGEEFSEDLGVTVGSTSAYRRAFERGTVVVLGDQSQSPPAASEAAPLFLTAREISTDRASQTITLQLRTTGDPQAPFRGNDLIVIDAEPLLIAKVHVSPVTSSLLAGVSDEIGNWTNRASVGGGWDLNVGALGFDLVLPPQGIGETMHRRIGAGDFEHDDAGNVRPADFRFSPSAVATIRPSFFTQRFADAPWNLRRILGFVGQREPGAGMDGLRFELIYGLAGAIANSSLRLAEIGSRLGRVPGQQPEQPTWSSSDDQRSQYTKGRERWARLYRLIQTRLAILEPYDPDRTGDLELRDADGLSFELRKEANLRYPITGAASDNPNIPPLAGQAIGLAGSFSWAFESKNVYEAVWLTPKANAAELSRPFLSSLGGWGHQKALFDNRRTTIFGDVAMGRMATLNVERIGRVSVFWNRAKHVIVYERTVAASRQFYLEQEPFTGNPILRKVDEYIELLEEERAFPDRTGVLPVTRGPVLGCHFTDGKPPRIRVNSRWGEDVNEVNAVGWKIPFWVRGAAPSDVYPKPTIVLKCAGVSGGELSPLAIDDPEKVFFFTSTDPQLDDDTNRWPAVPGIDFVTIGDVPAPTPASVGGSLNSFADQREPFVVPGTGALTFALVPGPRPVNIVAERSDAAIATTLRNVTLMRGLAIGPVSSAFANVTSLREQLSNGVGLALSRLPIADTPFTGDLKALLADARIRLDHVSATAATVASGFDIAKETKALEDRIRSHIAFLGFKDAAATEVGGIVTRLHADVAAAVAQVAQEFPTDVTTGIGELQRRVRDLIDGGEERGYKEMLRGLPGTVGAVLAQLAQSQERARNTLQDLRSDLFSSECRVCALQWPGSTPPAEASGVLSEAADAVNDGLRAFDFLLAEVTRQWTGDRLTLTRFTLTAQVDTVVAAARELRFAARQPVNQTVILTKLQDLSATIAALDETARLALDALVADLAHIAANGLESIADLYEAEVLRFDPHATWESITDRFAKQATGFELGLKDTVKSELARLTNEATALAQQLHARLFPSAADLQGALQRLGGKVLDDLRVALAGAAPTAAEVRRELEQLYGRLAGDVDEFTKRALMTVVAPVAGVVDETFRVFRALGDPPSLPQLNFPGVLDAGFYFLTQQNGQPIDLPTVSLSPLLAEANRIGQQALNGLELRLPTAELANRFMPSALEHFDWSKLFPNFAGLRLDSLFSGLRAPSSANDRVKLTHGEDPQTRSGWLQVDVNVPIDQPTEVFNLAGVTLRLLSATFEASSRVEATLGQQSRQTSRGSISGNWELTVGGTAIAVLERCTLRFENGGRISFDVSPDRVKLQQVLAFLADLMASFGYSDSGFSVAVTPSGVQTVLDLPLPDIQSGTFGISNLRLGFLFGISVLPEFEIVTQLSVGRKAAPFSIAVFILGGAGWVEIGVRYKPPSTFQTEVSIAILASASLAIALGPIKGGVYVFFGITLEYVGGNASPSRMTIGLLLLFVGEVSLLGIISVGLRLGLEAKYTAGGGLSGRGFVSFSIKICWCFTINVSAQVEYTFGAASGGQKSIPAARAIDPYADAARDYIGMFANA